MAQTAGTYASDPLPGGTGRRCRSARAGATDLTARAGASAAAGALAGAHIEAVLATADTAAALAAAQIPT